MCVGRATKRGLKLKFFLLPNSVILPIDVVDRIENVNKKYNVTQVCVYFISDGM